MAGQAEGALFDEVQATNDPPPKDVPSLQEPSSLRELDAFLW